MDLINTNTDTDDMTTTTIDEPIIAKLARMRVLAALCVLNRETEEEYAEYHDLMADLPDDFVPIFKTLAEMHMLAMSLPDDTSILVDFVTCDDGIVTLHGTNIM